MQRDKRDKGDTGVQGPQGNPGAPGGAGPPGPAGPSTAFAASRGTGIGGSPGTVDIVSKTVPAGSYAVNAKLQGFAGSDDARFECDLRAQGIGIIDSNGIDLDEAVRGSLDLQAVLSNYGGGTIDVACEEPGPSNSAGASFAMLTAIQVGSVQ